MIEFACDCAMGKHRAPIEKYEISSGAIKKIPEILKEYKRIYVVADTNTYRVAGKAVEELDEIVGFCMAVGLPVTLGELGVTEVTDEKLLAVAKAATVPGETIHNMPFEVTAEKVVAGMKAADAYGRYALSL